MPPIVAILNPRADRGRAARLAEALIAAAAGRFDLALRQTTRRGEAVDLARQAALEGARIVTAIGGDGAVHEVANGLMSVQADERPHLAIIPAGSGNDVAYALGITKDLSQAVTRLERGIPRPIDVAHVVASTTSAGGPSSDADPAHPHLPRYSINNIGTLLEGQINLASHQLHWPRGSGLYLRAFFQQMLRPLPDAELELTLDGRTLRRRATILSLGNGPRSGGKFLLVPQATVDDGRFDYLLAPPLGRLRLIWEVYKSIAGTRPPDPRIERGQFQQLTIRSSIPLAIHIDGEPWLAPQDKIHALSVTVHPRALSVLCDPPPTL